MNRRAVAYFAQHRRATFSLITRYEVLRGLRARGALTKLARFEAFCQQSEILLLDEHIIVLAADVWAGLKRKGRLIGDNDILIAATALHHGLAVATGNVARLRSHSRIDGRGLAT